MKNTITLLIALCATPLAAQDTARSLAPWLDDLPAATREAASKQRPIFVRFGGAGCIWCKRLEEELAKPEVQAELKGWTLVSLDVERDAAEARRLGVGPIPALRALAASGHAVGANDGYLEAPELIKWLRAQHATATSAPDATLLAKGEPSAAEVLKLLRAFDDRDALVREAAIRRLAPYPALAKEQVNLALRDGSLSARLAALELFSQWQAPVEELDPWVAESFTPQRLAKLDDWLKSDAAAPTATDRKLTLKELAQLEEDLKTLLVATDAEAVVVRERIARAGGAALPLVVGRLAAATTDLERERLLTLRYRLVATGDLALRWPGGLERLAATDVKERHRAADELSKMSDGELQPLLLELFSDPDPLVREIALRGLRSIGGKRSSAALVKLLEDPDANVRAAVLKQLAEDAQPEMLAKVGQYVQQEKDADLVVHAVRYLRAVDQDTTEYLLPLLTHESWQVRAEAAEGVGKRLPSSDPFSGPPAGNGNAIREKLLALLDDADAFVVSRAVQAFEHKVDSATIDPLLKAAEKHPGLAVEIVAMLVSDEEIKTQALPKLLPYLAHKSPSVRAAAIRGLVDLEQEKTKEYLAGALADEESVVRIAAAEALTAALNVRRQTDVLEAELERDIPVPAAPSSGLGAIVRGLFGGGEKKPETLPEPAPPPQPDEETPSSPEQTPVERRLAEMSAGKHRPAWTSELVPALEKMLTAASPHERAVAAVALLPLGKGATSIPVLHAAAIENDSAYKTALGAQKWLPWTQRAELFRHLRASAKNEDQIMTLLYTADEPIDRRLAAEVWRAIDDPALSAAVHERAYWSLKVSYFNERYYDASSVTDRQKRDAAAGAKPHAASGAPLKRLVAINLLLTAAPDEARAAVESLLEDASAPDALRRDAFPLLLLTLPKLEREQRAIAALAEGDKERALVALRLLTGGGSLTSLPASGYEMELENESLAAATTELRPAGNGSFQPIIPQAPKSLTAEHLQPRVADGDPEVAAYAGYLLALLGDEQGLEPLLAYWRGEAVRGELDRLVYRALAVTDNPAHIPLLRTIYSRLPESDRQEFYWTIRIMSGPEILQFREQIRQEVGMEELRGGNFGGGVF